MSRFMLNLQSAFSRVSVHSESDVRANVTSLIFDKVIGSIAATTRTDASDDADDDDTDIDIGIAGDSESWYADEAAPRVPSERAWENPFRDVEAAGTASLTEMSFRTGSSSVFH